MKRGSCQSYDIVPSIWFMNEGFKNLGRTTDGNSSTRNSNNSSSNINSYSALVISAYK